MVNVSLGTLVEKDRVAHELSRARNWERGDIRGRMEKKRVDRREKQQGDPCIRLPQSGGC